MTESTSTPAPTWEKWTAHPDHPFPFVTRDLDTSGWPKLKGEQPWSDAGAQLYKTRPSIGDPWLLGIYANYGNGRTPLSSELSDIDLDTTDLTQAKRRAQKHLDAFLDDFLNEGIAKEMCPVCGRMLDDDQDGGKLPCRVCELDAQIAQHS